MSFPPATEMFQFAGFASRNLCIQSHDTQYPAYLAAKLDKRDEWVSPFGNLRVKGCSHLTAAYRSVPRPSSPVCAKASTNCPYLTLESPHHQRQRWASPNGDRQLGRAARRGILVWMINLSQICKEQPPGRRAWVETRRSRPNRCHHGIDFKNPFTMSKRARWARHAAQSRRSGVFISGKPGWWSLSGSNR